MNEGNCGLPSKGLVLSGSLRSRCKPKKLSGHVVGLCGPGGISLFLQDCVKEGEGK